MAPVHVGSIRSIHALGLLPPLSIKTSDFMAFFTINGLTRLSRSSKKSRLTKTILRDPSNYEIKTLSVEKAQEFEKVYA